MGQYTAWRLFNEDPDYMRERDAWYRDLAAWDAEEADHDRREGLIYADDAPSVTGLPKVGT